MAFCHWPPASQVWTDVPLHCFAPGVQMPVQALEAQRYWQFWVVSQVPLAWQVWIDVPEHCFVPGAQLPAQALDEQT